MSQKILIITGMHRSGTSLVTNWLHSCGLQVGEELLGDAPGNTEGHFEDMEFLKMHEEILLSNNLPDTGLTSGTEPAVSDYQREKIRSIIDVKNTRFEQWGWKEPRTCLLLGLYHELLPEAKYLVIVRDYKSVVNSLLKRDFFVIDQRYLSRIWLQRLMWKAFKRESRKKDYYKENAEYYLKVWIWYNEYVLDHLKKLTRDQYLVVDYTTLVKDDRPAFSHVAKTWGFKLSYHPFKSIFKKNLISKVPDLSPFLPNQELVQKAEAIEKEFEKYNRVPVNVN